MKRASKWAVGIVLTAAAAFAAYRSVTAPPPEPVTQTAVIVLTAVETESPDPNQPCAFQWAYLDLPELTSEFDSALKAMNPQAAGRAQAFGENCIQTDGSAVFGAMETDFYVHLQVDALDREEDFGNWIAHVLEIVIQIPRESLEGPNYGFVEFTFEKSEAERIIFRVPIQQYLDDAMGISGAELFQMFSPKP